MKRMLMELGGKGAAVVFDDADIKGAITAIGSTWAFHSGQICTAPTRAVVHRSILDKVVEGLSAFAGYLKVGDPTEADTVVGPLISAAQQQRVLDHIETGRQQGEVVVGGNRPDHLPSGYYVEPTLIIGSNDITVAREEIFGPVVVVIPFVDEADAIRLANDTPYGLSGSIWTRDGARALRVARAVQAGNLSVNSNSSVRVQTSFGGMKQSGFGRELGLEALASYTDVKNVFVSTAE
jgi:acyl-CoA reductase-like NAD-dependent aldehyde dehydrogenase